MAATKKTTAAAVETKVETAKVEAPKATDKEEAPKTTVKAVKKEETAKKEATKKAPAKKETVKKETAKKTPAKKAPAKKSEQKVDIQVQFAGKSYTQEDFIKIAKDVWEYDLKQKAEDLKDIELYVKPEESVVYYVLNTEFTGSFVI